MHMLTPGYKNEMKNKERIQCQVTAIPKKKKDNYC